MVTFRCVLALALTAGISIGAHAQDVAKLLENNCLRCHSPQKKKGGVDLAPLAAGKDLAKHRKLLRRAIEQVEKQTMPPPAEPPLVASDRETLVKWGKQALVVSEPKDPALRNPGPALVRRLHRYEYNRSLHDLTGLEFDVAAAVGMPEEASTHSFDNLAGGLTLSPVLMEKYFLGAELLVEHLFKMPTDEKKRIEHKKIVDAVVVARPSKEVSLNEAARTVAASFAPKAFRRPVEKNEIDRLVKLFEESVPKEEPKVDPKANPKRDPKMEMYEAGLKRMLKAILVSPHFLFRVERNQEGTKAYRISDRELAVRLSYFLWSSVPDAELVSLAEEKKLSDPAVLEKQVRRMLADPKAAALTENFAGQWTKIRKLDTARPTVEFFPSFTPRLKQAMTDEVFAFFNHLRGENRSVLELIDADYTFVNDDLANHYGIKNIKGPEMRKISLTAESHRGGLSTMAGVLALTSHTNRTSPTLRGKWVLEVIFGTPPEPPPPDVSQIVEEKGTAKEVKSFRELLERHAKEATCAGCHAKIDPLGFGLENFDPIGRWRASGGPQKIDPRGVLPGGETFNGPKELTAIFLKRKTDFLRNLTEQMLTYALGRELDYYDEATIQEIAGRLQTDPRFETLILGVVRSYPFQWRKNDAE